MSEGSTNSNMSVKEHNQTQIEHVMYHKYYMSEKMGHEVSFDIAILDWINNGYAQMYRKGKLDISENYLK